MMALIGILCICFCKFAYLRNCYTFVYFRGSFRWLVRYQIFYKHHFGNTRSPVNKLLIIFQELNAEQLREAIVREIKDYCKASVPLLTFDLHPVVPPDSQVAAPAGTMPLTVGGSLPVAVGSLPVGDSQGSGGFLYGKMSSVSERERGERPTHLAVEATRVITDVEMLSGKLLELNMQDEGSRFGATCGRGAELRVCGDTSDLRDVVMLSAKARTESGDGKVGPIDTKALIKAALLNAEQRRQQHGTCFK